MMEGIAFPNHFSRKSGHLDSPLRLWQIIAESIDEIQGGDF